MLRRLSAASVTCPDVVRPAVETVARAVRVDAEAKLRGDNHVMAERRERFSHQFFVRERTICFGRIEERDARARQRRG